MLSKTPCLDGLQYGCSKKTRRARRAFSTFLRFAGISLAAGPGFEPGLTDPELVGVGFTVVRGCSETAYLGRILGALRSPLFADIRSGNC